MTKKHQRKPYFKGFQEIHNLLNCQIPEIADRLDADRVFAMMKTNDAFDILDYVRSMIAK